VNAFNYGEFHALKNRVQFDRALRSPVGRAVALREVREEMTSVGLRCLLADDGSDQRELLAALEISGDLMLANQRRAVEVMSSARALAADVQSGCIQLDAINPFEMPADLLSEVEAC
jgi:hypothetical protein